VDHALANVPADLLATDQGYEKWFKKYQLDLNDAAMLDADTDGDGASNRDEFSQIRIPRSASPPGVHKEIRYGICRGEGAAGARARRRRTTRGSARRRAGKAETVRRTGEQGTTYRSRGVIARQEILTMRNSSIARRHPREPRPGQS
jgi:hypothetical protein